MPEKPDNLSVKQTLKMRKNYLGKSCKLHFEVAPLKIVRASKQYMYDDTGKEYLDCIGNISHVGHCHPHVVSVGQEQMSKLVTCPGFLSECQVEYAKRIIESLPEKLCVCYFVNSGSEANEVALRLAWAYTNNKDVVVVDKTYHGNTETLIKVSPTMLKKHNIPKPDWVHIVPCPDTYKGKYREDTLNPGFQYAQEVKQAIDRATDKGRTIAAFICEPLLVAAGCVVPPQYYLNYVYRYIREAGGVCIADEVQTALGRTGDKLWGFQSQDVVPDIVTMAKSIGNGHPMAVVVTTKEISDSLKEFTNTFGGSPVACAMGIAVLDVIRNEKLVSSAKSVGKCLLDGFKAIMSTHPMMGDVRGMGLVVGVEIVMDKESRKPAKEAAEILIYKLKEQKIILSNEGPEKNILTFIPPMCFTCDNARTVVQAIDVTLREIETEASRVGLTSQSTGPAIEVPLNILTSSKPIHSLNSDEDEDDSESPSKRPRISYEEMD